MNDQTQDGARRAIDAVEAARAIAMDAGASRAQFALAAVWHGAKALGEISGPAAAAAYIREFANTIDSPGRPSDEAMIAAVAEHHVAAKHAIGKANAISEWSDSRLRICAAAISKALGSLDHGNVEDAVAMLRSIPSRIARTGN